MILSIFPFSFIACLFVVVVGFGFIIHGLNNITQVLPQYMLLTNTTNSGLIFKDLPAVSGYWSSIFTSFSILVVNINFAPTDLSPIGQVIVIMQFFIALFISSLFTTIFFTTFSIQDDSVAIDFEELTELLKVKFEELNKQIIDDENQLKLTNS